MLCLLFLYLFNNSLMLLQNQRLVKLKISFIFWRTSRNEFIDLVNGNKYSLINKQHKSIQYAVQE